MTVHIIEHPSNDDICFGHNVLRDRDLDTLRAELTRLGWSAWGDQPGNEIRVVRRREVDIRESWSFDAEDEAVPTGNTMWHAQASRNIFRQGWQSGSRLAPGLDRPLAAAPAASEKVVPINPYTGHRSDMGLD
jgi:hypothetical protein